MAMRLKQARPLKQTNYNYLVDRKLRDIWFCPKDIDDHIYLEETLK